MGPSRRSSSTAATRVPVIGGYVYRGEDPRPAGHVPVLRLLRRRLRGLQVDGDTVIDARTGPPDRGRYSLGQDGAGEVYVLLGGGRVVKLVAAGPPEPAGGA